MHVYSGVVHSFTHPLASAAGIPGVEYDAVAARRSWAPMHALLTEAFDAV
jgi:hypothetical protein